MTSTSVRIVLFMTGSRSKNHSGSISKLKSTAGAECVSAPTEIQSTPASANSLTFSSVIPPDASVRILFGADVLAHGVDGLAHESWAHIVEKYGVRVVRERRRAVRPGL